MKPIRRALLGASRLVDRVARGLTYAAMGTMNLADLRAGIERRWSGFFVDEADITSGFMLWESEVVAHSVKTADRVLVVGAGTGRDLLAFADMGCHVTGVEPSAAAIDVARRMLAARNLDVPIVQGFFEDVLIDGPFDVIVFSWFSYSYTPQSRRRVELLRKAKRLLAPGGRVIVSVRAMPEAPRSRLIKVQHVVGALCRTDWRLEEGDLVAPFHWSGDAINYEHMFAPGEFEAEAAAGGLDIAFKNREEWVFVLCVPDQAIR